MIAKSLHLFVAGAVLPFAVFAESDADAGVCAAMAAYYGKSLNRSDTSVAVVATLALTQASDARRASRIGKTFAKELGDAYNTKRERTLIQNGVASCRAVGVDLGPLLRGELE